ncbi:hypothetical protein EPD60_15835 [Flaviaesturariibacter flavus]|uniref:Uncharacterized protein n=1 Tax=Flaviaesturariibacter flavus TaxID=2502780 RepID=A0A4V2NV44_9BACT|nr:hypothetical protein [Flaviaesturariibacter flavus]TCJ12026.1 hypothetical protein EPD60_15835 [Flaviaesturariibacter flavus]
MDEKAFLQLLNDKAQSLGINPFLLLSGLEGLYTFREVPLNEINMEFLDSLVLTLLALRIGDQFHGLAEEQLGHERPQVQEAARRELEIIPDAELEASNDPYLRSFAAVLSGKAPIRRYHIKALEAAAQEVHHVQLRYNNSSIGAIMIEVCKTELSDVLPLGSLFNA